VAQVVAVFGVSGVGKSWLISRFASANPVAHVQASQLLREAKAAIDGCNTTPEQLRRGAVLDNQTLLIQAFTTLRIREKRPIIFDGHSVIDNDHRLVEIPCEVIEALLPSGLILVQADAFAIARRRAEDLARIRPNRTAAEIGMHQDRARIVCTEYAKRLHLALHIIDARDEDGFASAVASILTMPFRTAQRGY
jgi:adenylate kinase